MGMNSGSNQGSGFNQYQSTPINLQYPSYQAMAPQTAQGIGALQNLNPYGATTANGNTISPYFSPAGNFNNPNTNPLVAPMTQGQQQMLGYIGGLANPGQGTLNNQAATTAWNATNYANSNPLQNAFNTNNAMLSPGWAAGLATNPLTQMVAQGAAQPLLQQFQTQTIPQLQGAMTAAGQRTNSANPAGGSSAYDIAAANAETGLGANLANLGSNIIGGTYQTGLGQTANAVNQASGLSGQNISNLINAATGSQGLVSTQLNDTINALNANALPQLTQQYGINQGLSLYQTQVNQLMTALGLGGQTSQPAIGYNSMGGGTSQNNGSSKGFSIPLIGR